MASSTAFLRRSSSFTHRSNCMKPPPTSASSFCQSRRKLLFQNVGLDRAGRNLIAPATPTITKRGTGTGPATKTAEMFGVKRVERKHQQKARYNAGAEAGGKAMNRKQKAGDAGKDGCD